jgi:TRAP-type C4-dicarboxylate transport system permease small subunit
MTGLKRTGQLVLDILEIYIPSISFIVLFVVFIVQVFYRYFLNSPLTWPPEVISTAFIWTTVLGACYAQRLGDHVSFTVVYERLSARGQLIFRILGNAFVAIAFLTALVPVYNYVQFSAFAQTSVLRISYTWVYAPFLVFQVLIIGRMSYAIYKDIQVLLGRAPLVRDTGLPDLDLTELEAESLS